MLGCRCRDINPSYRKFIPSLDYDVCYIDFLIKEAIEICGDQPVKDLLNLSDSINESIPLIRSLIK